MFFLLANTAYLTNTTQRLNVPQPLTYFNNRPLHTPIMREVCHLYWKFAPSSNECNVEHTAKEFQLIHLGFDGDENKSRNVE